MNSAIVKPTTSTAWSMSAMMRRTCALVRPLGFRAEAEHDLVAVDGVDAEVDSYPGAAGTGEPVEERRAGFAQLVGAVHHQTGPVAFA